MNAKRKQKAPGSRTHENFAAGLRTANAEARESAFEETIRSIPAGKVATYGQVAQAAGYPRGHRLVARFLRETYASDLPWQRVIGAGGEIKVTGKAAVKQRSLLKAEGVISAGNRIDMAVYQHAFEF